MRLHLKRLTVVGLGALTLGALGLSSGTVGAAAAATPSPTPAATPGPSSAPQNVVAVGGVQSAKVTWMAPANSGGGTVAWYAVYAFPQDTPAPIRLTNTTSIVWDGLHPRTFYTFTVTAWNGTAWSAWSAWSNWAFVIAPPPSPVSCSPHPCSVSVSQENGAQVDLKVGDTLLVNESDNAFIQWNSTSSDPAVLKLVSQTQPPAGTAGAYQAQFSAVAPGMADVMTVNHTVCNMPPCPAFPNQALTFHVMVVA